MFEILSGCTQILKQRDYEFHEIEIEDQKYLVFENP